MEVIATLMNSLPLYEPFSDFFVFTNANNWIRTRLGTVVHNLANYAL
jgi:hypothetical protein